MWNLRALALSAIEVKLPLFQIGSLYKLKTTQTKRFEREKENKKCTPQTQYR